MLTSLSRALVFGSLLYATAAFANSINSISVANNSSPNDGPGANGTFVTQSSVSSVSNVGNTSSFTHRMAFYSAYDAPGTVAQTHREIVNFDLQFTVDDPGNVGFDVSVESVMRGISSITQNSNFGNQAVATGLDFFVEMATVPPGTFSTLIGLFHSTPGVTVTGPGSNTALQQDIISTTLGNYVGTTTFVLRLNSLFSPATNIFFQNLESGSGFIDYGLGGAIPPNINVDPADLGNFLNVKATFVPEPSTLLFGALGVACMARRRVRSGS